MAALALMTVMMAALAGTDDELAKVQTACEEKAKARFGMVAEKSASTVAPKKVKSVAPKLPLGIRPGSPSHGIWLGVALVDPQGKVADVWQARSIRPDFDGPIIEAIRLWQYKPLLVAGRAMPFCLPVSARIELMR